MPPLKELTKEFDRKIQSLKNHPLDARELKQLVESELQVKPTEAQQYIFRLLESGRLYVGESLKFHAK